MPGQVQTPTPFQTYNSQQGPGVVPDMTINQPSFTQQPTQSQQPAQPSFQNAAQPTGAQQQPTLEDKLKQLQDKWTNEITELNGMMKTLQRLDELLNIIYTKRQEAVDYYHNMNAVILKQTKEYKQEFNVICMNARINGVNGLRLQNDTAIQKHAESVLLDKKAAIEQLGNHNTFIKETVQTIDNMIYGINQKIKLAEILNGLKF